MVHVDGNDGVTVDGAKVVTADIAFRMASFT